MNTVRTEKELAKQIENNTASPTVKLSDIANTVARKETENSAVEIFAVISTIT